MTSRDARSWDHHRVRLVDILVALVLVVGFFIGPLKLLGGGWLSYALPDALTLLILIVVFGERIVKRVPLFAANRLAIPLLLLSGICVLQLANPVAPFIRSVMGLRTWLLYLGFFFVGFYTLRSSRQIEHLYALLLTLGVLTAAYGVYQWRAGPQAFASWSEDYGVYARTLWSAGFFRAFSTFLLPNSFGSNMGLLMLVAFTVAASPRVPPRWRLMAGGSFILMGVGIAASGTRAPLVELLVAGLIGIAVLPGMPRRLKMGVTGVGLSLGAVLLVSAVIGPAISRRFTTLLDPGEFFWKWFDPLMAGFRIATAHPFGMGTAYTGGVPRFINNPAFTELPTTTIDSGYGSAAAELGLLGLAVFVYFAAKVGLEGVRAWRRLEPGRVRDLMLTPSLFAALYPVLGLIGGTHASIPSSIYFWLLIGMLIKAPKLQKENGSSLYRSAIPVDQKSHFLSHPCE